MTSRYGQLLFTAQVRSHQESHGSRRSYAHMTEGPETADRMTEHEAAFAATRTHFYLASTGIAPSITAGGESLASLLGGIKF